MDWDGGVDLDPEEWERRNFEQDLSDRYRRLSSTVKMLPTEEDQLGYLYSSLAMADLLLLPKALNLLSSSEYTEMVRREGLMTNSLKAFKKSIVLQVRQIRKAGSAGEDPGDKESDSMGSPQLLRLYTPKEMQTVVIFFKEMVNRGWIEVESSDQVHARITNAEGSHLVTEGHPPFITPANKTRNYEIKSLYCKHGKNRYQATL
jgi:hypothetical protein